MAIIRFVRSDYRLQPSTICAPRPPTCHNRKFLPEQQPFVQKYLIPRKLIEDPTFRWLVPSYSHIPVPGVPESLYEGLVACHRQVNTPVDWTT